MSDPYLQYYHNQAVSGNNVYQGATYQKGHGIGSFLGGLFRSVMPLFKRGAKAVGKELLSSGVNVVGDIMDRKPIDQSFKSRFTEAKHNLKRKAQSQLKEMIGSGYENSKHRKQCHFSTATRTNNRKLAKKKQGPAKKSSKVKNKKKQRASQRISDIFD